MNSATRFAAALIERSERCYFAWAVNKGERFLEQARSRVQESLREPPPPPKSGAAQLVK